MAKEYKYTKDNQGNIIVLFNKRAILHLDNHAAIDLRDCLTQAIDQPDDDEPSPWDTHQPKTKTMEQKIKTIITTITRTDSAKAQDQADVHDHKVNQFLEHIRANSIKTFMQGNETNNQLVTVITYEVEHVKQETND